MNYITIIFLIFVIAILILIIKYVNGDFSPVNIIEISKYIEKDNIIITYKYEYQNGSSKLKHKHFKLK